MIRFRGARLRRTGRRHAPSARGAPGTAPGPLRSIRAAVRLHPVGFGVPAAVIAAGIAYLVIAGPVSVRLGPPGRAGGQPQVAAQAPPAADPTGAARPGSSPGGRVRLPRTPVPGAGFLSGDNRHATSGLPAGQPAPNPAQSAPVPGSPSPSAPAPSPAPTAGGHATCVDLDVVTVCV